MELGIWCFEDSLGFGTWDLGFRAQPVGFGAWDLGFRSPDRSTYAIVLGLTIVEAAGQSNVFWFDIPEPGEWILEVKCHGRAFSVEPAVVVVTASGPEQTVDVRLVNVSPTGMTLDAKFDVDFEHFPTGQARPHDMLLK